ncbi:hypothetical protein FF1_015668 [Malus domestica]
MKSGKVDSTAKVSIHLIFKILSLQFLSFILLLMLRREWISFSISPEDLLAFTFKASIGEVVGEVSAQTGAAGGEAPDVAAAKSVTIVEDEIHLFGCFGLPIALRISRHGHMLLDAIFLEELRQIFAHELQAVVGDDGLRDAKSLDAPLTCECQKSPLREYVRLKCARLPSGHRWAELLRSSENFASGRVYAFIVAGLDSAE